MLNFVVLIMLNFVVVFAVCPKHWGAHKNKCFFLSRDNETFADALVNIHCSLFKKYKISKENLKGTWTSFKLKNYFRFPSLMFAMLSWVFLMVSKNFNVIC